MNFSPDNYNDSIDSIEPANKLISIIKKSNNNDLSLILDIGCGSGITTRLLNSLKCQRIIGCDIDPAMIEFAKKHNKPNNVDYLVQDFGVEWDQLDERLRQLEGKVPVIFSNYALTWIYKNRHNATENISRLLTNDGFFICNLTYDGDIFASLPENERKRLKSLMPYPSEEEVVGGWVRALKNGGLTKIDLQYWEPTCIMPKEVYIDEFIQIPMNWYKTFLDIPNFNNQSIDKTLKKLIYAERCRLINDKISNGRPMVEIVNKVWQIIARKNLNN